MEILSQKKKKGERVRERALLAHTPENSKVVLAAGMAGSGSSSPVILSWLYSAVRETFSGNHAPPPAKKCLPQLYP